MPSNPLPHQAKELIKACYDAGVNFFDNAEVYASGEAERLMGQAIQASLARLQTDYVDLLYCHRPDPDTPIEETVRAMNHCIDTGMAFYWGTSEWSAEQIQQAQHIADRLGLMPPVVEQPEYNMFERKKVEQDFLPLYDSPSGLGLTIWSPLASGILTGKYGSGTAPEGSRLALEAHKSKLESRRAHIQAASRLEPIAKELGCTMAQLALAWTLRNPHVSTTITGASRVSQVTENMGALAVVPRLTGEVLQRVEAALGGKNGPDV
ncbi:hypothetical protein GPECTOR_6g536 [Gonium pectorale]|uniref:NADP-dependent oxidoreductase domain-containing protein n=1 Tax=Gonium pectorale TaxID=33097 RepID=A0A150GUV4_GONPE|nr:hypothetical protein GPECTOR_6g536 [Gonium pectorale]|eukprot:KXZ53619.1 hypothetical protein GPECTOR_6g536 [Gonium pectorale]